MAKMAARCGHFGIEEMRSAVDSISRPARAGIPAEYPQNPPQSGGEQKVNMKQVIDFIGAVRDSHLLVIY
jgi:hypothetical protein